MKRGETENSGQSYFDAYDAIAHYQFVSETKIRLCDHSDGSNRVCRFCRRGKNEGSFSSEAHAVPHFMGNRAILSLNECDDCNAFFSDNYEDDLSRWCLFPRAVLGLKGKKKKPTFKAGDNSLRVSVKGESPQIEVVDPELLNSILQQDQDNISFKHDFVVPSQSYTPRKAALALVKIACSVCPIEEMEHCQVAIDWLMKRIDAQLSCFPVYVCSIPESSAMIPGEILLLRRRESTPTPFLWCVLRMTDRQIQWFVPGAKADESWLRDKRFTSVCHPPLGITSQTPLDWVIEDWSTDEPIHHKVEGTIDVRKARKSDI